MTSEFEIRVLKRQVLKTLWNSSILLFVILFCSGMAFANSNSQNSQMLDVVSNSGVKFFANHTGRSTHQDLYAIPNTNRTRGWQVQQIGEAINGRTPVEVCRHRASCYKGWVPTRWTEVSSNQSPMNRPLQERSQNNLVSNPSSAASNPTATTQSSSTQIEEVDTYEPDTPINCLATATSKRHGLALRSVLKVNNQYRQGKFLNCSLNPNVDFCITGANTRNGDNSWVEAVLNQENFSKLSPNCQRSLNNAVYDGDIEKTANGEFVISFSTFRLAKKYLDIDTNSNQNFTGNNNLTEASNLQCDDCHTADKNLGNIIKESSDIFSTITATRDSSSFHPEGWPISNSGFSFPLDPSESYITSEFGVRRLHGRIGHHAGIDFGTFGTITPFHAMKGGRVIQVRMNCPANGSESCNGGYGNQIKVQHDDGTIMFYNHLHANCRVRVSQGEQVGIGQRLGCVGSSGRGPIHLDVRLLKSGGNPVRHHFINHSRTRVKVLSDFVPLEGQLDTLYAMILRKRDFRNQSDLRIALARQSQVIGNKTL